MVMTRGKVGFIIVSILVLVAVVLIPFLMKNDFGNGELAAYLVAKIIIGILLIVSVIYALLSKSFTGTRGVILSMGFVFQIVPLFLRLILNTNSDSKYIWYVIILIAVLIAYIGLSFGLSGQSKAMDEREEIAKSNTIEVQEEKRLATDNSKEGN